MPALDPVEWAAALGCGSMDELAAQVQSMAGAVSEALDGVHHACTTTISLPESEVTAHLADALKALEDAHDAMSQIRGLLAGWT